MLTKLMDDELVVIRGGGALASGVALRLWRCGFRVVVTELAQPICARRGASLCVAVHDETARVEEMTGCLVATQSVVPPEPGRDVPVVVDPTGDCVRALHPAVLVDATMSGRVSGTTRADAPLVVALGAGLSAGEDVHAVIQTCRGNGLGQVVWQGSAEPETHRLGTVESPMTGRFRARLSIGEMVHVGDVVGWIDQVEVQAPVAGILRGVIQDELHVEAGQEWATWTHPAVVRSASRSPAWPLPWQEVF